MGVCKLGSRLLVLDIFDDMEILSKILLKALKGVSWLYLSLGAEAEEL